MRKREIQTENQTNCFVCFKKGRKLTRKRERDRDPEVKREGERQTDRQIEREKESLYLSAR